MGRFFLRTWPRNSKKNLESPAELELAESGLDNFLLELHLEEVAPRFEEIQGRQKAADGIP